MNYTTNTNSSYYCYQTNFRNGMERNVLNVHECPSENVKGGKFVVIGECDNYRDTLFSTHNKRYLCNYVAYVYKVPCQKKNVFFITFAAWLDFV